MFFIRPRARLVGALLLSTALAGCETSKSKEHIQTGTLDVGPASKYPAGSANTDYLDKYGIVITNDSGTPLAILTRTRDGHDGVTWNAKKFQFESNWSSTTYDLLGRVVKGHATASLPAQVPMPTPDGTLVVNLDALYAQ